MQKIESLNIRRSNLLTLYAGLVKSGDSIYQLIANATLDDITNQGQESKDAQMGWLDGRNLVLNTGSLTFRDVVDTERQQGSSMGLGLNFRTADASNNNVTQDQNYYSRGSSNLALQDEGYEKSQTTKATIGVGSITTSLILIFDGGGNVVSNAGGILLAGDSSELVGLNRDVTETQVITKDTITGALNINTTVDLRLFDPTGDGQKEIMGEVRNMPGNLLVGSTSLTSQIKDAITTAFETNPNDQKNDSYFEVLNNKANLRANSILNTRSLLQNAENAKYYNNPSDNKAGFYDPETGETYINLAYNQSTGSLMETTLHEAAHQQNNLSKDIEEGIAHNYADTASDLINFYHNKGEYSDNLSSQLVSWAYQNSGLSSQYNSSESYLNNFYGISTANVTPASIAVNNFVASTKKDNEVETAYFALRPLEGSPWLGILSHNKFDDAANTEVAHEHLFFEDAQGGNIGYSNSSTLFEESGAILKEYRITKSGFDDAIMREAVKNVQPKPYSLLGSGTCQKYNCQDWSEDVRKEYYRIEQQRR